MAFGSRSTTCLAVLALVLLIALPADAESENTFLLQQGRLLFYEGIEDKASLDRAIALFSRLSEVDSSQFGVAQTYIGALTAMKAIHTPWPHSKLHYAKQGLAIMDAGLAASPENIEALFIHGSTCHFLPFFFNRKDDAQRSFQLLMRLLPEQFHFYENKLVDNMIRFLQREIPMTAEQQSAIAQIQDRLQLSDIADLFAKPLAAVIQ